MAVVAPIVSKFDPTGVKQAETAFAGLRAATAATGAAFKAALGPATIALGGLTLLARESTEAALADAAAQDALARQLAVSTGATEAQVAAVEQFIAAQSRATATADDELRPALGNLVRATRDVEKAQKLLALAQDISAATGKDLQSVSIALAKAANGQVGALTRLGVPLDAAAVKTKNLDRITGQLAQTFAGAAERSANTAEGRIRGLGIAVDETKEAIGAGFIPILRALVPVLQAVADWTSRNTKTVTILAASIGGLAATIILVNGAMRAYAVAAKLAAAAQAVLNFVVKQNPWVRAGLLIAAVVTALSVYQRASQDAARTVQQFGRITQVVVGAAVAGIAMLAKSLVAGAYLIAKVGQGVAKVTDFVLRRNDEKDYKKLVGNIDSVGRALDSLEMKAIDFGNANVNFAKVIDRAGAALKGFKAAADTKIGGGTATFPAIDDLGAAAEKAGGKAAKKATEATKKVTDAVKKAQEQAAARLRVATDRFRDAFGDFTDRGLKAFDAETTRLVREVGDNLTGEIKRIDQKLQSDIARVNARYAAETTRLTGVLRLPTEAETELARVEALRDETDAARDLRDAQEQLAEVRADEKATANDLRDAEERLADVLQRQAIEKLRKQVVEDERQRQKLIDQVTDQLEEERTLEVRALEDSADRQRTAAEQRAADRERELTAERELLRENLDRQLAAIEERVAKEPKIWQTAHDKLMALFANSFGPEFERAGANVGAAYVRGVADSISRLSSTVQSLGSLSTPGISPAASASASAPELNLIVNAGLGTNGAQVGSTIVSALQDWQRRNGALPLRVTGY